MHDNSLDFFGNQILRVRPEDKARYNLRGTADEFRLRSVRLYVRTQLNLLTSPINPDPEDPRWSVKPNAWASPNRPMTLQPEFRRRQQVS